MMFRAPATVGEALMPRWWFRGMAGRSAKQVRPTCRTISDVIANMTSIGERLEASDGPGDGVLAFNRLYLAVTQGVQEKVDEPGYFDDPDMIAELDVLFAQLYFDAVETLERGERAATLAWRVLFEARDNREILPIQFAVAGMNAHINHDLPIALIEQWMRHRKRPTTASVVYADFEKINMILKREEEQLKRSLEPKLLRELDQGQFGRLEDKLALWAVEDARARAWTTAEHLWAVRRVPLMRRAWLATVDGVVGALGRVLLEPV
jgi:hypothetical protein